MVTSFKHCSRVVVFLRQVLDVYVQTFNPAAVGHSDIQTKKKH